MNDTSLHNRPRPWRLQFSLRLLFLAFSGFAIGFPIWYRWPYEEEEMFQAAPPIQRITTWQRQWGGGRLKHGLERIVEGGTTFESQIYRQGLKHGPYEGQHERGQFVDDLKEGVWTGPFRTSTWHRGKLDGLMEFRLPPERPGIRPPQFYSKNPRSNEPRKIQLIFAAGRLTHFNDKPAANRLFDILESEAVDEMQLTFTAGRLTHFIDKPATNRLVDILESEAIDERTASELRKEAQIDFVEMPLADCLLYLSETHQIPFALDPSLSKPAAPNADMPITDEYRGIDLCSMLTLLTAPRGLACDYRYGSLWVTTAADGNDWHDPTGVSEIKPPSSSMLAKVWNEAVVLDAVEMPLTDALKHFEGLLAIHIDATQLTVPVARPVQKASPSGLLNTPAAAVDPFSITASLRGVPFRHVLGQLLYRANCRCQLEGDKLVILPPEEENETKPQP